MDRGIHDECFVSRALDEADFDMGRWIAHQDFFNHSDKSELLPSVRAAVVTATSIYCEKYNLPKELVGEALSVKTCGDARAFIDKIYPLLPSLE